MFRKFELNRTILDNIDFNVLSSSDSCMLEENFIKLQIIDALWGCEWSKSPCSNRYNLAFIRKYCHFIKDDFVKFFKDSHGKAKISKSITSYFLTLIPKPQVPIGLGDYYPICLVGCLYKVFSKLLA